MHADLAESLAAYPVVVLDGCDGTGKTTIARTLRDRRGHTVVHCDRTPDGADVAQRYLRILENPGRIVLDRSFISELVYGPLFHGRSRITGQTAINLAQAVTSRNGALVHVIARPEVIAARLTARDGNSPPPSQIGAILAAYQDAFTLLAQAAPVITADTFSAREGC